MSYSYATAAINHSILDLQRRRIAISEPLAETHEIYFTLVQFIDKRSSTSFTISSSTSDRSPC